MKWHLYKRGEPSTYPQVDCPMLVIDEDGEFYDVCRFHDFDFYSNDYPVLTDLTEFAYYAYIAYIPNGYKTLYPTKCMRENDDRCAYEDDGYCMDYDNEYVCGCKKEIAEYKVEMKRIWKEFKHDEY